MIFDMKLLYLADIRFPMERANGIQTVETCHALARNGVEVELVVRRSDGRTDRECLDFYGLAETTGLELERLSVPFPGTPVGQLAFLVKAMNRAAGSSADALYTRDLRLADIAIRSAFWHHLPVIYEAHTSAVAFSEEYPRLYQGARPTSRRKLARLRRREGRVCRGSSRLVTITEGLAGFLRRCYGTLAPTEVIPDGTRVPHEIPPLRELGPGDRVRITYLGQLYPWKGVDVLLKAATELPENDFVIVGGLPPEPDLDRTRSLARELGISERVEFLGYLPPTQLNQARRDADIFVIPLLESTTSRYFTSPLKLFEAMAAGRPIVASDLPSIREVLNHGVNAVLVPPGDPRALADSIRGLSMDRRLRARLAQRAGEDVRAYSWDARGGKIARLVRDTVDRKH
jgi:glycosyltransferase involved in cell wall biosynthesis